MKPKYRHQCLGLNAQGNELMRAAWDLNLKHGDDVWVIQGKTGKSSKWKFSHYTQAGARLFCRADGQYYSRLVNWDNKDRLFLNEKDLNVALLYNVISKRTSAEIIVESCDKEIKSLLEKLK